MTQYVTARFKHSTRAYTFHNDGERLAVGDFVEAESRGSTKVVEICAIDQDPPPFPTNPIIQKVDRPEGWPEAEKKDLFDGE